MIRSVGAKFTIASKLGESLDRNYFFIANISLSSLHMSIEYKNNNEKLSF